LVGTALDPIAGLCGFTFTSSHFQAFPLLARRVTHKNENTGSKDRNDYDESENLCQ